MYVQFRLEYELELARLQGATQSLLGGDLCGSHLEEIGREHVEPAAAQRLRAKQGRIRSAQECGGVLLVVGIEARTDAHADGKIATVDRQGLLERLNESQPRIVDLLDAGRGSIHDCELIP